MGDQRQAAVIALVLSAATSVGYVTHARVRGREAAPAVHARFDLTSPAAGPFPSDRFTEIEWRNRTGRRIHLPTPDCAARPSDCEDIRIINTLDGFNLQPRLSVPFDGPIDVTTVNSQSVFLVRLDHRWVGDNDGDRIVGINQIVWDGATNTLHAESDELLHQHTRYVLIVTRGVRDLSGNPVASSAGFGHVRRTLNFGTSESVHLGSYQLELIYALVGARRAGIRERDIVAASVFTTQSITPTLERIRDRIHASVPKPAEFRLGQSGRAVFPLGAIAGITANNQTRADASPLTPAAVPVSFLHAVPGAVGQVAFGKYVSPSYLTSDVVIPATWTSFGAPRVQSVQEVHFNLYIPAGTMPAAGWPVAIFGHGRNGDKNFSARVGASMASRGIATISINAVGHGFGPSSTLTVTRTDGTQATLLAGGRGFDQNGDGAIGASEGWTAAPTNRIVGERDGNRQTVVDLMQLARVIGVGMDVDGDSFPDLDPSRILYFGFSMGGIQGAALLAVDPSISAGVLNSPGGGGDLTIASLSPLPVGRPTLGTLLASRVPSLLNAPGLTSIGDVPVGPPHFNENLPLRGEGPVLNAVDGATDIQQVLDNTEWVRQSADPSAYAVHLRQRPLRAVQAKSVIVQFARGDQNIPNPLATAIVRAGGLADRTTMFRNDLAFAANPGMPKNPHRFMVNVDIPAAASFAFNAQRQVADFFASGGDIITLPEPAYLFEVPILVLPEEFGFIP